MINYWYNYYIHVHVLLMNTDVSVNKEFWLQLKLELYIMFNLFEMLISFSFVHFTIVLWLRLYKWKSAFPVSYLLNLASNIQDLRGLNETKTVLCNSPAWSTNGLIEKASPIRATHAEFCANPFQYNITVLCHIRVIPCTLC